MNSRLSKRKGRTSTRAGLTDTIKSTGPRGILACSLRGLAVALLCCVALLFMISAAVYSTADPNRFVMPAAFSALYISALLGGFTSARLNRGSVLLCGLLTALLLLGVLFVLSLLMNASLSAERGLASALGLRGIAVGISILGACIGVSNKKKKPKRR